MRVCVCVCVCEVCVCVCEVCEVCVCVCVCVCVSFDTTVHRGGAKYQIPGHHGSHQTVLLESVIVMKEMFYLTTHPTHFIYGYMVSDIW